MEKKVPLIKRIFDIKMWLHDFTVLTGLLPVYLYFRCKRVYPYKKKRGLYKGKYIISSNHMSLLDPIIICQAFWFRRVGFVATKSLFERKLLGFILKKYGVFPIDKENPSLESFKKSKEHIDRGHISCFFPEGMVNREEEMGVFKSGIIMLAIMAKCDILPVYLVPRKKKIHRQVVVVGDKIEVGKLFNTPFPSINELTRVTDLLKEKEEELEEKYNQMMREKPKC